MIFSVRRLSTVIGVAAAVLLVAVVRPAERRIRSGRSVDAQVGGTRPGRGGRRVTPGRLVGDQLAERRQVRRRGRRQDLHRNDLS